jgi:penicillin-binding protein 1C
MSAPGNKRGSSWPGKSAKRVFAQMSRPSTTLLAAEEKEDVDGRVKPGHDAVRKRGKLRTAAVAAAFFFAVVTLAFSAWVISLGPLPLTQARQVSATIVDRHEKLLRAYAADL